MIIPRPIRITILLLILFLVAMNGWLVHLRATDWEQSLWVVVYPLNGDQSEITTAYLQSLTEETFEPISEFMVREARAYGLAIDKPLQVVLAPELHEMPPKPPAEPTMLSVGWWSLKMRYWAFWIDPPEGVPADLKMFVVYWQPQKNLMLQNSFGLEKGMVGVVNAFAFSRMDSRNNVVLIHEIMHTLGATDKYDYQTFGPLYPDGFAEPDLMPLYPQEMAEIMGGRIAINEGKFLMPANLYEVVVGPATAREIRWVQE